MKNSTARKIVMSFSILSYLLALVGVFLIIKEHHIASLFSLILLSGFQIPVIVLSLKEAAKDKKNVVLFKKRDLKII
jgi:hypothetical protein